MDGEPPEHQIGLRWTLRVGSVKVCPPLAEVLQKKLLATAVGRKGEAGNGSSMETVTISDRTSRSFRHVDGRNQTGCAIHREPAVVRSREPPPVCTNTQSRHHSAIEQISETFKSEKTRKPETQEPDDLYTEDVDAAPAVSFLVKTWKAKWRLSKGPIWPKLATPWAACCSVSSGTTLKALNPSKSQQTYCSKPCQLLSECVSRNPSKLFQGFRQKKPES